MFKKVDLVMQSLIDKGIPGNDIIIYHKGKEVYRSYRGFSDKENKLPMTGKERYNIYSASKPITCVTVMQLIEKNMLSLDTPLYHIYPEFETMYVKTNKGLVRAKNNITVRHLLTMTAGFSYNLDSPELVEARKNTNGSCPTVKTVRYLAKKPLHFEAGTKWEYSLCHDILAAVVETVSGVRFGEYVKRNIFDPLNMNNSTFSLPDSELDQICAQYKYNSRSNTYDKCTTEIQYYKLGREYESGGAGCISTVEDYIKFLEAMRMGDVILDKDTIKKMCENIFPAANNSLYWPRENGYGYGLGLRTPEKGSNKTDFGWGGAAGAYLAFDIENEMSVYYAQHVLHSAARDGRSEIILAVNESIKAL